MDLSQEEIIEIKTRLIEQILSTFPEERKEESIAQIEAMGDKDFVEFLKRNNLIQVSEEESPKNQCIFCSIVFEDVPSTKIGENEKAIAILEINPISEGHSLIIPKRHIPSEGDLGQESYDLAREISEKIKEVFEPKEVKIIPGNVMGHEILNLLPVYEEENLESKRTKKTSEELKKMQEKIILGNILEEPERIIKSKIESIDSKDIWLPKRIP